MMVTKMDRTKGTKWFTFYAKVRPWFSVIGVLLLAVNAKHYLSDWYLMVDFLCSVVSAVLAVIVWVKSSGDYGNFVHFVKGVLIFECLSIAYSASLTDLGVNDFLFLAYNFLCYFVWYRPNINYFKKRLLQEME